MKELQSAVRQYQHNDCSGLVMGYDRTETELVVSNLLRERNELAAQVERLRGSANGLIADCEEAVFNDESVFCVNHDVVSDLEDVLSETPAQSLEAVKREWKESIDSAIEGFAFTTSEGQWVVHRDDVSGLLSK